MYEAFEFNGIHSGDVGISVMNFDGFNTNGVASVGDEISFTTTMAAKSSRNHYHGYKREQVLTTSFQIGKNPCESGDMEFSREEFAFLKSWLERKDGYKFLRFFQKGYEDTYFYCQNHIEPIRIMGKIVGAEISVTCNAPYGYSPLQGLDVQVEDGGGFTIYNDSDEQGSLEIDQMEIGVNSGEDCTISIRNNLEDVYTLDTGYECRIAHCNKGEQIVIDGLNHSIATTDSYHARHTNGNISEDFNFHYPRLINISSSLPLANYIPTNTNYKAYGEDRINRFTVTGADCSVTLLYRTIRSVMP